MGLGGRMQRGKSSPIPTSPKKHRGEKKNKKRSRWERRKEVGGKEEEARSRLTQVLCGGVNGHVDSGYLERALVVGCGECAITHDPRPRVPGAGMGIRHGSHRR
eukprot:scaffold9315_cov73-Isochrysis_galbana.AAC.1